MHRLMISLERALAGESTDLRRPIEHIADLVSKRGMIVLISDLLAPVARLQESLSYLRSRGHDVVLMRILDPAERDFSFADPTLFRDLETGKQLYVDPQSIRDKYLARFRDHASQLSEICGALGVDMFDFTSDRPLEMALFDFMQARMRRGRTIRHRASFAPSKGAGTAS